MCMTQREGEEETERGREVFSIMFVSTFVHWVAMFATLLPSAKPLQSYYLHKYPLQTVIHHSALVTKWCEMTTQIKSSWCPSLSVFPNLNRTAFPALMRTAGKTHLTDEFIWTPADIKRWYRTEVIVGMLSVCRTLGPDIQASWKRLSAAAPPADLWAPQWTSLAAPHSAREKEGAKEQGGLGGGFGGENGLPENRPSSFAPGVFKQVLHYARPSSRHNLRTMLPQHSLTFSPPTESLPHSLATSAIGLCQSCETSPSHTSVTAKVNKSSKAKRFQVAYEIITLEKQKQT